MPPKAKITVEMIIQPAIDIIRERGWESSNARSVANKLGCSTQPIMYHFSTIEELKLAAYSAADEYHTSQLMNLSDDENIMLQFGLNYIRFAVKEPNLYRFLFQSGLVHGNSLTDLIESQDLMPLLEAMQQAIRVTMQQTKDIFLTLFLFVHGYASMLSNNSLEYSEDLIKIQLCRVFDAAVLAAQNDK